MTVNSEQWFLEKNIFFNFEKILFMLFTFEILNKKFLN